MSNEPQVPNAPFKATPAQLRARRNVFLQLFRLVAINLKMIGIIRKGHN